MIEIYKVHNPPNVKRVDYLLAKYRGQEDVLYRSVCAKYKRRELPTCRELPTSRGMSLGQLAQLDLQLLGEPSGFFEESESELDDEFLAAALQARLPAEEPKDTSSWGAPPPLREAPAPPFFDQWLAVLKFLTGWSERTCEAEEIREALKEHLEDEAIEHPAAADRLCATIVPLLLDLRSVDYVIMKLLKEEACRLKSIQVSILRIVTFELCREREEGGASAYLASDISALAKAVQHFRFERGFHEMLQRLISRIRRRKRPRIE